MSKIRLGDGIETPPPLQGSRLTKELDVKRCFRFKIAAMKFLTASGFGTIAESFQNL